MSKWLRNIWEDIPGPLSPRHRHVQCAALCTRINNGQPEVLLITSRNTGRWIIPKGWPIDGLDGAGTARQEAWEEAGVRAMSVDPDPIGRFTYDKVLKDGSAQPVLTWIYHLEVKDLAEDYPEVGQRNRVWLSPAIAAERVQEHELRDLLQKM
ncbi:NUDIX hydrolase [Ruegeria sp. ANG-S4]|uniref:NUDIX hydrolase n=1 Tax=Ruegeria sp. ANG-S4 TaxID=1577904 RepID=UPI00058080D2|nr:NUDIX hydrolase [Ruegeria sp. ANG-S4]KIC43799.1 NUDIX hydrolase [Ruegeria sp. ANG-S4]